VSLGDRCDAIVRLIDETLADLRNAVGSCPGPDPDESVRIAPVAACRRARAGAAGIGVGDRDEAGASDAARPAPGF
jgi:hypothetical protein